MGTADTVSTALSRKLAFHPTEQLQRWWRVVRHLVHGAVRTREGGLDAQLPVVTFRDVETLVDAFPLEVSVRFTMSRGRPKAHQAVIPLDAREGFKNFASELRRVLRNRGKRPRWVLRYGAAHGV